MSVTVNKSMSHKWMYCAKDILTHTSRHVILKAWLMFEVQYISLSSDVKNEQLASR